jgi:acyl-coenzyme A synthetase/AMP-(fatty) acid ligase
VDRRRTARAIIDNYWQTETGWPILSIAKGIEDRRPVWAAPACHVRLQGQAAQRVHRRECGANEKGVVVIEGPLPPGCMQTVYGDDQRFVDTYWSTFTDRQVYSTFDWGMRDADGYYFILGRTDDVINVAGHRLGTREIEESITSHPNVSEVAVVGVEDKLKGQVAVAFVIAKNAAQVSSDEQRAAQEGNVRRGRSSARCGGTASACSSSATSEDPFRQAAAPFDTGDLRGPQPGRPDRHRRSCIFTTDPERSAKRPQKLTAVRGW